ncbi:MAG: hypothetical protein NZ903_00810 [Candidatus Micrarchaeota archaeon]|nr:hypothetical protein [Candidatus Micrarchaeota archaeon]
MLQKTKNEKKEEYYNYASIFLSVGINAKEEEIQKLADFIEKSNNPIKTKIKLNEIIINLRDKELLLKIVDELDKTRLDPQEKYLILNLISTIKRSEMHKIDQILFCSKLEGIKKIFENYKYKNTVEEIILKIAQRTRYRKKEAETVIGILSENETMRVIEEIEERYKDDSNKNQRIIAIGEIVHLAFNSKPEDFRRIRENLIKIIDEIKKEYNITHFGRYSANILNKLYEYSTKQKPSREKNEKLFVFVASYSDYNGAFYNDYKQKEMLSEYGKVLYIEVESDVEFIEILKKIREKYGSFNGLFIEGHGSPTKIRLNDSEEHSSFLDITDYDIITKIGDVMDKNDENRFVVLISCSTGEKKSTRSIANYFASIAKIPYVFAPEAAFTDYHVNTEGNRLKVAYYKKAEKIQTMEFESKER